MLNAATDGRAWQEHEVKLSKILQRNETNSYPIDCKFFLVPHLVFSYQIFTQKNYVSIVIVRNNIW